MAMGWRRRRALPLRPKIRPREPKREEAHVCKQEHHVYVNVKRREDVFVGRNAICLAAHHCACADGARPGVRAVRGCVSAREGRRLASISLD